MFALSILNKGKVSTVGMTVVKVRPEGGLAHGSERSAQSGEAGRLRSHLRRPHQDSRSRDGCDQNGDQVGSGEDLHVNEHDEVLEKRPVAEEDVYREEVELDGEAELRNR